MNCSTPGCDGLVSHRAVDPQPDDQSENLVLAICPRCSQVGRDQGWRVDRIGKKSYDDAIAGGEPDGQVPV